MKKSLREAGKQRIFAEKEDTLENVYITAGG